jgi:lipid-binding SYLF domain-containing protein
MRTSARFLVPVFVLFLALPAAAVGNSGAETARVESAAEVMGKIMEIPEKAIPPTLLSNAQGIAVVPNVIKVGLVVGGQFGNGVLSIRGKDGAWSNPVFVTLTSGSVGWQIGAESTDFVIVFKSRKSIDGIMKGKYTLGADAAVAAGPVGRRVGAATDVELKAEIFSFSRNRGLFAGVSLEGSALQIDGESGAKFYGKEDVRPSEILEGRGVKVPAAADGFRRLLEKHVPRTKG